MFQLTDNQFVQKGICVYTDEDNNRVRIQRIGNDKFKYKLKFANIPIKCKSSEVRIDDAIQKVGFNLAIEDPESAMKDYAEDIYDVAYELQQIIWHWVLMLNDIGTLNTCTKNKDSNKYAECIQALKNYGELEPLMTTMF